MRFKAYYLNLVNGRSKGAGGALLCFLLLLASFIYGLFVKLISSFYQAGLFKSYQPPCRVIGVGNITWGGTGKTPLVEALAKFLKQQGKSPAVLIRGYGDDEIKMLEGKFKDIPVLAGRDRIRTAKAALERYSPDTIILDDGFQHWRLRRDLDIVLIDTETVFGNRRLIPRGILREPLSSLSRADIFVLTKANQSSKQLQAIKQELRRYNSRAPIYEAIHAPCVLRDLLSAKAVEFTQIKDQPVALICGIARPESFAGTLTSLGAKVRLRFCFPDHYRYSKEDVKKIEDECLRKQVKIAVTTEKDIPRLNPVIRLKEPTLQFLALGIEFKIIKDEEKFFHSDLKRC